MSVALESRAEIFKIARLLELQPDELEYLDMVPPQALRKLRDQIIERFFGMDAGGIARIAEYSDLFPPQLIAAITREAVGPFLAARIAGLVDPHTAVQVVKRLSPQFLADVASSIDPRRAHDVIGAIPPDVALPVTEELAARGEWIVMGSFVGHLDDDTTRALIDVLDDAGLLQIAFAMEDKTQLAGQIALFDDERIGRVVTVAAEHDLWPEALDLMLVLRGKQRRRVIDIALSQDAAVLDAFVRAAYEEALWPEVLRLLADAQTTDAAVEGMVRAGPKIFRALIDAVDDHGLWPELRSIHEAASAAARARFFKRVARLGLMSRMSPVADLIDG